MGTYYDKQYKNFNVLRSYIYLKYNRNNTKLGSLLFMKQLNTDIVVSQMKLSIYFTTSFNVIK